jgi:hypothetical protein
MSNNINMLDIPKSGTINEYTIIGTHQEVGYEEGNGNSDGNCSDGN